MQPISVEQQMQAVRNLDAGVQDVEDLSILLRMMVRRLRMLEETVAILIGAVDHSKLTANEVVRLVDHMMTLIKGNEQARQ